MAYAFISGRGSGVECFRFLDANNITGIYAVLDAANITGIKKRSKKKGTFRFPRDGDILVPELI
jgi:hypothetical protein